MNWRFVYGILDIDSLAVIFTNLLLVGIKTAVVFISGSLAVTADAIHSLSDVGSDI